MCGVEFHRENIPRLDCVSSGLCGSPAVAIEALSSGDAQAHDQQHIFFCDYALEPRKVPGMGRRVNKIAYSKVRVKGRTAGSSRSWLGIREPVIRPDHGIVARPN